jgi:hypothetical protein
LALFIEASVHVEVLQEGERGGKEDGKKKVKPYRILTKVSKYIILLDSNAAS